MSTKYPDGYECRIKGRLETEKTVEVELYPTCAKCPFVDSCELMVTSCIYTDGVFFKGCRYIEELYRLIRIGLFKKFGDILIHFTDEIVFINMERRREDV